MYVAASILSYELLQVVFIVSALVVDPIWTKQNYLTVSVSIIMFPVVVFVVDFVQTYSRVDMNNNNIVQVVVSLLSIFASGFLRHHDGDVVAFEARPFVWAVLSL